jgi:SAM-dependent methyltransferase
MKEKLLQYLACPACAGDLRLREPVQRQDSEIVGGELQCANCPRLFPIERGVPRFANIAELDPEKVATAAGFSFEWQHFTQRDDKYGEQLLGWLAPVTPDWFRDKIVLDGGCGKGRHLLLAQQWGAREVIGVDLSEAVETAFAATRHLENVHVVQGDLCQLPFKQSFDYAFSVGVLDHLPNPAEGFISVAAKILPGGHLSAWVYGAENNEWITRFVNPLRTRFTSRLNARTLLHVSKIPTAVLYALTKLVYGPAKKLGGKDFARRLFYGEYLSSISGFGWREQHTIVFDHLVAPTAHYLTREEFEECWRRVGVDDATIGWHNQNSWRGLGQLKDSLTQN